jgi:predicted ATP-grasp superfamily ATP-dependent carboligase
MIDLPSRVLVTNFSYKNALATVRSLGKAGANVIVGGRNPKKRVAAASKYSSGWRTYTPPSVSIDKFIKDIKGIAFEEGIDIVIPIGVDTTIPLSYHKNDLADFFIVPVADYDVLELAHDKLKSIKIAERVGVPVPETVTASDGGIDYSGPFPAVVKARRGANGTGTRYATSTEDLEKIFSEFREKSSNVILDFESPMIQEYIPGEIRDVCVLFNLGQPRAAMAQRRVVTFPPGGGIGIVNETIEDPELIETALCLLEEIGWHGVAQVEFKLDHEGTPRLMEVNSKFWGTLELSIASGVDIPRLLLKIAEDGDVEPCFRYEKGLQVWWTSAHFPQLFFAFINERRRVTSALKDSGKRRLTDIHLDDLKPHILQFTEGVERLTRYKMMLQHPLSR